jgi:hypothetical protein
MTGKLFLSVAALLFASTLSPTETKAEAPGEEKIGEIAPEEREAKPQPEEKK